MRLPNHVGEATELRTRVALPEHRLCDANGIPLLPLQHIYQTNYI